MDHQLHEVDSNASKRKCSLRNSLGAEPVKGSADFGRQVAHLGVGSEGLHPTRMETAQHHLSGRPSILGSHITLNLPVTTPVRDGKQLNGHGRKVEDALILMGASVQIHLRDAADLTVRVHVQERRHLNSILWVERPQCQAGVRWWVGVCVLGRLHFREQCQGWILGNITHNPNRVTYICTPGWLLTTPGQDGGKGELGTANILRTFFM